MQGINTFIQDQHTVNAEHIEAGDPAPYENPSYLVTCFINNKLHDSYPAQFMSSAETMAREMTIAAQFALYKPWSKNCNHDVIKAL